MQRIRVLFSKITGSKVNASDQGQLQTSWNVISKLVFGYSLHICYLTYPLTLLIFHYVKGWFTIDQINQFDCWCSDLLMISSKAVIKKAKSEIHFFIFLA